jgi:OFA family oxalate/formate antiporter-like MFS transporter
MATTATIPTRSSTTAAGQLNRWWRVAGGLSMNMALGTLYAWSVFVAPLEKEFHWTRSQTSNAFTIAVAVFALTFIAAGHLQDKFGPFWISIIGGVLVSLGFFLCSYTSSLAWLYVCFGVIGGLGNGFGYSTPIPVMAKWFPDKRGLAVGLAVGGYGAGSAIFGPLASKLLIPTYGWRPTFMILGGLFFVMTIAGSFFMRNPPAGYHPARWQPSPSNSKNAAGTRHFTPAEVLRTRSFYFMWLAYALGASAGLMVISQLVPFAKSQGIASDLLATLTLVVAAAGNAGGRILSGWVSDHLGRLNVLRLMIGLSIVAMPLLYMTGSNATMLYVMVFIVYWCYGTQLSVNASTTSDFWGTKNAGINYGLLFTAWGVAGIIGPRIAGQMFDKFNNYKAAFYTAALLSALALGLAMLARRPSVTEDGQRHIQSAA